jgi:hypothetical protein
MVVKVNHEKRSRILHFQKDHILSGKSRCPGHNMCNKNLICRCVHGKNGNKARYRRDNYNRRTVPSGWQFSTLLLLLVHPCRVRS